MVYTPKFKKGDRIKNIRDHRIDQVTDVVYKKDARYPFHEGYGYILYPRGGGWWLCEDIDIEFEIVPGKTENDKLETEETEETEKTEQSNRGLGKSRRNTKRRRKTRGNKRRKTRGNKRRKTKIY